MKYIVLFFGLAALCSGSSLSGRIINGIPSGNDDTYAVTVFSAPASNGSFPTSSRLSTGVAVTSHVIVVAAQAVRGFGRWRVGVDSNNRDLQTIADVGYSSYHYRFNPETLEFNIGVLYVDSPINNYIRLASSPLTFPVLFAIGFGFATETEELPNISQQSAAHLFDDESFCRRAFNARVIRPTNFCVASVSRLGRGDQGAPLVDFGRNEVYGIVSFWDQTDEFHNPVVVTDFQHQEIRSYLEQYVFTV